MTAALLILAYGATDQCAGTCRMRESITLECIIFHKMIVEDEFVEGEFVESVEDDLMNPSASKVYNGTVDYNGVRIPFPPVQRDGINKQAFWDRIENLKLSFVHAMLQNDLGERNSVLEAN